MTQDEIENMKVAYTDLMRAQQDLEEAYRLLRRAVMTNADPRRIRELQNHIRRMENRYWSIRYKEGVDG